VNPAEISRIGVAGAGTMGAGIAQAAILGGLETVIQDPDEAALEKGISRLREGLAKGAERGRWSKDEAGRAIERFTPGGSGIESLAGCDLVIEAAPEELELKRELFAGLAEVCGPETVLATNTSSLSVTAIAAPTPGPERVVGMHFFNPPVLMELVEVVAGDDSNPAALEVATEVVRRMGKTPIRARDSVGFVGNRCLRPFTLEALRMLGEGLGSHEEIDRVYRLGGGFRMGPFELMDLIGIDVNFAVARSFYEQSFGEPRWRPHPIQARLVAAGRLGRKSGRGFYSYEGERHREPDPEVEAERPLIDDQDMEEIAGPLGPPILGRLGAQIANEACFALAEQVASAEDINTAMRLGFNWPLGPLEWGERLGWARAVGTLEELRETHGEPYLPSPLLRRLAFGDTEALTG
jgi:3-hydroxybutyryl-CoA dehydrogenase